MHKEALAFIGEQAKAIGVAGKHVLEVGSYDVNGTPRKHFEGAKKYVGLDLRPGPGVDVVADLTEWLYYLPVQIIVCAETLEHARDPAALIGAMVRSIDFGGHLILTCATDPRLPHDIDGRRHGNVKPYQNIDPDWLETELLSNGCVIRELQVDRERGDLYVLASYSIFEDDIDSEE